MHMIMYRDTLPISQLTAWSRLNNVEMQVKVVALQGERGSGLVAERPIDNPILLTIPHDLILSPENVWMYAKSDKHLRQVLEITGEYSRVPGPIASIDHSEDRNVD